MASLKERRPADSTQNAPTVIFNVRSLGGEDDALLVERMLDGKACRMVVDTGANVTLVRPDFTEFAIIRTPEVEVEIVSRRCVTSPGDFPVVCKRTTILPANSEVLVQAKCREDYGRHFGLVEPANGTNKLPLSASTFSLDWGIRGADRVLGEDGDTSGGVWILFTLEMEDSRPLSVTTPIYTRSAIAVDTRFLVLDYYYTLSLWFPELVTRHEMFFHVPHVMQSAPPNCMLGSSPADLGQHPLLVLPRPNSSDEVQLADDNPCLRDGGNLVYVRMLLVAFSCMPATVWLILHVDILGRRFFVGKYWALTFVLP
uniref:Uncharacterized protein n=1 Tax=Timema douglasi TaxID=61478 RepID=A0A7R8VNJ3_TIMDO|nr:unnamed protein product [Timema douglasi]